MDGASALNVLLFYQEESVQLVYFKRNIMICAVFDTGNYGLCICKLNACLT